jgi:hypothetical protein
VTTVTIAFEDRDYWIKRIDLRIAHSEIEYQERFKQSIEDYEELAWWVRRFFVSRPVLNVRRNKSLDGTNAYLSLKRMLQMPGWKTMQIDDWLFRCLSE